MTRKRTYQIYEGKDKTFRWRLIASNGRNIRNGGQPYNDYATCFDKVIDDAKGEDNYRIVRIDKRGVKTEVFTTGK